MERKRHRLAEPAGDLGIALVARESCERRVEVEVDRRRAVAEPGDKGAVGRRGQKSRDCGAVAGRDGQVSSLGSRWR
jgi:hypothetical protein